MIIRETPESFIFISQHDHAHIAGEFFSHLKKDFIPVDHYESLKFAIYQHDRGWIIPDSEPLWNDKELKPYSFLDYPELLKLHFYRLGIEQVDQANSYSAILCSMHYATFNHLYGSTAGKAFLDREISRQKYLLNKLKIYNDSLLRYQLKILQLCDDLSLYVCLNKPGVNKNEEHIFFKDGFDNSEFFSHNGEIKLNASFINKNTLKFNSSPFESTFEVKITYQMVPKKNIIEKGLQQAFAQHVTNYHTLKII